MEGEYWAVGLDACPALSHCPEKLEVENQDSSVIKRTAIIFTAILATLLLSACANNGKGSGKVSFGEPSHTQGAVKSQGSLLDFRAPKLGGGVVNGNDFAGQDLALWFWAPW